MQARRGSRTIGWDVQGSGDQPLFLLPALGTLPNMWRAQVAQFSERFLVITADVGGHTQGPEPGRGLDSLADDCLAVLDALGAVSTHIAGVSLGGMVAQEVALRFPERVRSLVLICTTGWYPPERAATLRERARAVEGTGPGPPVQPTMERWFTPAFRQSQPAVVASVAEQLASASPAAYAATTRAVAAVDTLGRLPTLQCPVLIVDAEHDASMPPGSSATLAAAIPGSTTVRIPGAHLCPVESPVALAAALNEHFDRFDAKQMVLGPLEPPVSPW